MLAILFSIMEQMTMNLWWYGAKTIAYQKNQSIAVHKFKAIMYVKNVRRDTKMKRLFLWNKGNIIKLISIRLTWSKSLKSRFNELMYLFICVNQH